MAVTPSARAQSPVADHGALLDSGLPDIVAWWAEPGRVGWMPDADQGAGFPVTLAGHVRGAWHLVDAERSPLGAPFPGLRGVQTPLPWFDSLTFSRNRGAAWDGFHAGLVRLEASSGPLSRSERGRSSAQAEFTLAGGSSAYDDNALSLRRGDSLSWLRAEAESWKRGGVGALANAGRHLYGSSGIWQRGRHRFEGSFGQRGSAAALVGGEEQTATGASGHLGYGFDAGPHAATVTLSRSYDHRESFGILWPFSRRDAQEVTGAARLERSGGPMPWAAQLEWRRSRVVRTDDGSAPKEALATSVWGALHGEAAVGTGRALMEVGLGTHDGVDRTGFAPSLAYRVGVAGFDGRVGVERILAPVWSDLEPGQAAFLQSTWGGGVELGRHAPMGSVRLSWLMGRTRDRALVRRAPLEEQWLRQGFRADPVDYDFGLAQLEGVWRGRFWSATGEAYHLFRDVSPAQPLVDPRRGGRGAIEVRFRWFQNDLGVRLGAEAEAMGSRVSEASAPRWLEGYVTFGASAIVALADAHVVLRVRNLENRVRPQTWVDSATGSEALGPGREMRLVLNWRLFN